MGIVYWNNNGWVCELMWATRSASDLTLGPAESFWLVPGEYIID